MGRIGAKKKKTKKKEPNTGFDGSEYCDQRRQGSSLFT
jgi:hypothetical protein